MNKRRTSRMEFASFHDLLMKEAPDGYEPHYIRCEKRGKLPDIEGPSWKMEEARLSRKEADEALAQGYNVALAAMKDDPLVLIDLDNPAYRKELPATLQVCSRSNVGFHAYGFMPQMDNTEFPVNIGLEPDVGSVRSDNQYCLVPGSFVPAAEGDLIHKEEEGEITEEQKEAALQRDNIGHYVIHNAISAGCIPFNDLPQLFIDDYHSQDNDPEVSRRKPASHDFDVDTVSALFQLSLLDIFSEDSVETNFPHPVHGSEDTGANFRINKHEDGALAHCYRCEVSLNTLQYLCVESGYWKGQEKRFACKKVGSGWDNCSVGESAIIGDNQAIWESWRHAKQEGYIPEDDRVPVRALHHLAREHELCPEDLIPEPGTDETLPYPAYKRSLEIIEDEY